MSSRANRFSLLLAACLVFASLSGCDRLAGDSSGVRADSVSAAVEVVGTDSTRPDLPFGETQANAAGQRQEAGSVDRAAGDTPEAAREVGVQTDDSLAARVAALVLEDLRGQVRDTIVVRIDTSRAQRAGVADSTAARPVDLIQDGLKNVGTRILAALLLIVLVYYLLQGLLWVLEKIAERSAARRLFIKRLIPIARMLIWAVVIYFIIASVFQVDKNGLLAASAALGVGIGLAAQDLIRNLLGGIIIIFDAPFQVGDKVRVGETYGEVKSIGLRSTRIVTLDDNLVSVPNSQVVDGQVANANAGVLDCQVVTKLYLPGWTDAALAKQIAFEAAANSRYVYLDKPIVVLLKDDFKETFLTEITVKAYVLDHLYESALASDITETAKMGFLKAGLLYPVYGLNTPGDASRSTDAQTPS